jgi:hypothetical protein
MESLRRVCTSSLVFLAAVTLTGCFRPMLNIDPARRQTKSAIDATKQRIHTFWNEHRRLPSSTAELPDRPDESNESTDAWGRELSWAQIDEKTIRISSFGKDGKPGGAGDDADRHADVVVDQQRKSTDTP